MAGLCEGGNDAPGSLKAINLKAELEERFRKEKNRNVVKANTIFMGSDGKWSSEAEAVPEARKVLHS
ncbi:hypothetical protein ANN_17348 [Periplaneta americana]|uniref:Uncharacterized protein n=1 Tax=Periplaneta americana TaxID=6978 RepID=A0ABQ8ST93_PERAM|nr:hypothetical protein ANN_17348 [Periplaneta americana]